MASSTLSGAFIGLLFLANTLATHGQDADNVTLPIPTDNGTYVGFRVGYSNYHMTGSEADFRTTPYRVQYSQGSVTMSDENLPVQWVTVGAILRKRIVGPLSFQAEANYLREGGSFKSAPGGGFVIDKSSYVVDYLQIPALLNLTAFTVGPMALHLEGGLALNMVLSGVELDKPNLHPDNKFNNPSLLAATVYGAEITWQHQKRLYLLNFRYSNDLSDFYQREYVDTHYNLRSSGFSVATGILFGRP
jgi:hypothetical protein